MGARLSTTTPQQLNHSHQHQRQHARCRLRLEIVDGKGRTKRRPDVLRNICRGKPTHRRCAAATAASPQSSRLFLSRPVLYREHRDAFVQGMQQHSWIQLEELSFCSCGLNHTELQALMLALQHDMHKGLKRLRFKMKYEGSTPTLELITELMISQRQLQVLDLSGSFIYTQDLPSFIRAAIHTHPNLQKLVLSNTNAGDHTATLLFRALASGNNSAENSNGEDDDGDGESAMGRSKQEPPRLKQLEISSSRHMQGSLGSMSVLSTIELMECLPYMDSLDTLVLQHLTFHRKNPLSGEANDVAEDEEPRRPSNKTNNIGVSLTFFIHHVEFLDMVFQRFNLLQDRLPSALWPILGYVQENIDGVAAAPYFSKRTQVWNELLLAGLPLVGERIGDRSEEDEDADVVGVSRAARRQQQQSPRSCQLLPDWKACWQQPPQSTLHHQHHPSHYFPSSELSDLWRECSFHFSKSQRRGQDNSFKATALFFAVEALVVGSWTF